MKTAKGLTKGMQPRWARRTATSTRHCSAIPTLRSDRELVPKEVAEIGRLNVGRENNHLGFATPKLEGRRRMPCASGSSRPCCQALLELGERQLIVFGIVGTPCHRRAYSMKLTPALGGSGEHHGGRAWLSAA